MFLNDRYHSQLCDVYVWDPKILPRDGHLFSPTFLCVPTQSLYVPLLNYKKTLMSYIQVKLV